MYILNYVSKALKYMSIMMSSLRALDILKKLTIIMAFAGSAVCIFKLVKLRNASKNSIY